MVLYDLLAPVYDPFLKPFYAPFRRRALEFLKAQPGSSVLDLACGTGQNFPFLESILGKEGMLVGIDTSSGMLQRARQATATIHPSLLHLDVTQLSPAILAEKTGRTEIDAVVCTYGFTSIRNWEEAFHRSYALLKPGGIYLIHDIHAEERSAHVLAFEFVTRTDLSRKSWEPLQKRCPDFHFEYIDPSAHIFAGRLFVARGIKPLSGPVR